MKERWKAIDGYEGYYKISNLGRVFSIAKGRCKHCGYGGKKGGLILQNRPSGPKKTYWMVSLSKPDFKGQRARLVHRLVAEHFIRGRTKERRFVNHKDGDKRNNVASNLEWVTPAENARHAVKIGRHCWKNPNRKYVNPWPTRRANVARKAQQRLAFRA
jgi:hypothetical protein